MRWQVWGPFYPHFLSISSSSSCCFSPQECVGACFLLLLIGGSHCLLYMWSFWAWEHSLQCQAASRLPICPLIWLSCLFSPTGLIVLEKGWQAVILWLSLLKVNDNDLGLDTCESYSILFFCIGVFVRWGVLTSWHVYFYALKILQLTLRIREFWCVTFGLHFCSPVNSCNTSRESKP